MHTLLPPAPQLISELIAIPSVSSAQPELDMGNQAVIERISEWCQQLGFRTEILPLPGRPGKANLVATLGYGSGALVLAGHTDTVPFDLSGWNSDPLEGSVREGNLYGLGASDMKGFFALALSAVAGLGAIEPHQPLVIVATCDEETSMAGARELMRSKAFQGRYALIGEPTAMRPAHLHKGVMMERIRIIGHSGHSSDPSLGRNALDGMHRVITALMNERQRWRERHHHAGFAIPYPTLNLGHIHGGDNPNRICGACELHFDVRLLPGMEPETLRDLLRSRVDAALADLGLALEFQPLFDGLPPLETPTDSPLVAACTALTGQDPISVAFGTEGPYYRAMGMDAVILGPGNIEQAHQPNEYLALDRIAPMIRILQDLIVRFCLTPAAV
ncbi:MAG TPA: acetylornithine deacetylase [Candidatus Macondimonas sp.]|nr:acetylornithine deacetylase [Candidatus Macondimonas sp.]